MEEFFLSFASIRKAEDLRGTGKFRVFYDASCSILLTGKDT